MAAALAFHALFSLFPLLLSILSLIGALMGPQTAIVQHIRIVAGRFLPPEVQALVKETILTLYQTSFSAGIIGFCLLLYSASTVFGVLRKSVNNIWRSPDQQLEAQSLHHSLRSFLLNKLFSFLLPFGIVLLLLISLISSIAIKITLELLTTFQESLSWMRLDQLLLAKSLQLSSSLIILSIAITILFKVLPTPQIRWRDVWPSGILTAIALVTLQQLVSNSVIRIGSHYLSYGVIGSVMILMLWIYFTCLLFFIGCEFSYVYTHLFGSRRHRLQPSEKPLQPFFSE
jgi:membrane protein